MKLKDLYIEFFKSKEHVEIPSASVVPENDPTSLFNSAGMQPLIPYLMGEPHPLGTRLTDVQKCIRLDDLDLVGDEIHHTFFEMLGNWSLGDYFKKESIGWSFEFLTTVLKIPINKLAITVFKGNNIVKADEESPIIWHNLGIPKNRIAYLGEEDNWWGPVSLTGPCGPDTEIFYFRSNDPVPTIFDPKDDRWVEIWNNVFMEYNKDEKGNFIPLEKKNVDTGMGVERTVAVLEGIDDNYLTSIWIDIIKKIEELSGHSYIDERYTKSMRIVADHIRTSVIISGDNSGIKPSNTDQGYILRRLIRRMIRHAKKLDIDINSNFEQDLAVLIINKYSYYKELIDNKNIILEVLRTEKEKFNRTLEKGLREFEKLKVRKIMESYIVESAHSKEEIEKLDKEFINQGQFEINAVEAFKLYDTYGFPIELTEELANEQNIKVDTEGFNEKFKEHQEKSRIGAINKFKGGLSNTSEMNIKYHTATHLLNAALKEVLGDTVHQKGSNITDERMRFDFSWDQKMTPEQIKQTEDLVNSFIDAKIDIVKKEMPKEEALKLGAEAMFVDKYGDIVSVYSIGDFSKEICGGPHVKNIGELGHFKIIKEKSIAAGVRRIKAILINK
ncbi:MAG: alanine--tRNA ligase [Bacilli bacterium]